MDYYLIAYVFLVLIILFQAASSLFGSSRTTAGIVVFILFILIFVFYGMRWFRGDRVANAYNGAWPPVVNTCPDYLTYYKKPKTGSGFEDTCIDLVGMSRNNGLTPWSPSDNPNNPPSDSKKYFMQVYKPGMGPSDLSTLCNAAQTAGLTWEGITNGEACTYAAKV
jgi:hypothetical protein